MAIAEREPITGVWDGAPSGCPGAEPPVRGSRGEATLKLNPFCICVSKGSRKVCPITEKKEIITNTDQSTEAALHFRFDYLIVIIIYIVMILLYISIKLQKSAGSHKRGALGEGSSRSAHA